MAVKFASQISMEFRFSFAEKHRQCNEHDSVYVRLEENRVEQENLEDIVEDNLETTENHSLAGSNVPEWEK